LLTNVGLSELIMPDLAAYEEKAVALAEDKEMLLDYRHRLENNRTTALLFDTELLMNKLEVAYRRAWDRFERGEAAEAIHVD
jgi:predicted O-linked N-acetylglucosamine transferase (SPINDLY family)